MGSALGQWDRTMAVTSSGGTGLLLEMMSGVWNNTEVAFAQHWECTKCGRMVRVEKVHVCEPFLPSKHTQRRTGGQRDRGTEGVGGQPRVQHSPCLMSGVYATTHVPSLTMGPPIKAGPWLPTAGLALLPANLSQYRRPSSRSESRPPAATNTPRICRVAPACQALASSSLASSAGRYYCDPCAGRPERVGHLPEVAQRREGLLCCL